MCIRDRNDGGGATTLNGTFSTGGSQTYTGAVTLASATTLSAGGSVSFVTVTGTNSDFSVTAGANIAPGTINVGSGTLTLIAGGQLGGGTLTGTSTSQNLLSSGGTSVTALTVDFQNVPLELTGAASSWTLFGPATTPQFSVTNPLTNIFYLSLIHI